MGFSCESWQRWAFFFVHGQKNAWRLETEWVSVLCCCVLNGYSSPLIWMREPRLERKWIEPLSRSPFINWEGAQDTVALFFSRRKVTAVDDRFKVLLLRFTQKIKNKQNKIRVDIWYFAPCCMIVCLSVVCVQECRHMTSAVAVQHHVIRIKFIPLVSGSPLSFNFNRHRYFQRIFG